MGCPAWRQTGGDRSLLQGIQVPFVGKTGVTGDLARLAPEMDKDIIDQRHQCSSIG